MGNRLLTAKSMSEVASKSPLVFIVGPTGTGKTKLSIDLAQKFNGEIIGADSMQIFSGLDIATAKPSKEQLEAVPHHLIGTVKTYLYPTVIQYRRSALKIIADVQNRGKVPIVVGGTNYYVEALLWRILLERSRKLSFKHAWSFEEEYCQSYTNEKLYAHLTEIDPEMAIRIHPNNRRKLIRALEVWHTKGIKMSQLMADQQREGNSPLGGGLRFPNTLILYLKCDQTILYKRLRARIDNMLEVGLLLELQNFRAECQIEPDFTKGIFQMIGLKEFQDYLVLSAEEKSNPKTGQIVYEECLKQFKSNTCAYAHKQVSWIRNRLLTTLRATPPVYGLDVSDLAAWEQNVYQPATEIMTFYLQGKLQECAHKPMECRKNDRSVVETAADVFTCEFCEGRRLYGRLEWQIHLKSKTHRYYVRLSIKNGTATKIAATN